MRPVPRSMPDTNRGMDVLKESLAYPTISYLRLVFNQPVKTIRPANTNPNSIPNRTRLMSRPSISPNTMANHMATSLRDFLEGLFITGFCGERDQVRK
ncbi:MAG: hypothetical protein RL447_540 [Bacteroidota bacterium]